MQNTPDKETISTLHAFTGHPGEFWPLFCSFASRQVEASQCLLLVKKGTHWRPRYHWPPAQKDSISESNQQLIDALADKAANSGSSSAEAVDSTQTTILGIGLKDGENLPSVAIFFIENSPDREAALAKLQLLCDTPAVYQRLRKANQNEADRKDFADILDLLLLLNAERNHLAVAMTLVNEVAARHKCSRVSLGWCEDSYIKLTAISHMESFDPKMDIADGLEATMEEAFDQDLEILFPPKNPDDFVTKDHASYAGRYNVAHLLSLPLRYDGQQIGVLTCERETGLFSQIDLEKLRLLCDQVSIRLLETRERDRGLFARVKNALRNRLSTLLGVENTLTKALGLLAFTGLLAAAVIHVPYRVEAPFILRSEDVLQVSTPFKGYIDKVEVRIGQLVEEGDLLLTLDSRDLLMEETAAAANQIRFLHEAEKARATGSLVDMKIAQARADHAGAQLELVRHRLSLTELRSPLSGIIVEGDLEQLRGAPVESGDILFKIARHEKLFIEAKVSEEDIHELNLGQHGEFSFVSRPQLKYPFKVDLIDPVALTEDSGNVFLARGRDLRDHEPWWRPGMSGVAKIDVGNRSLLWIATHRTIDFFQLLMWW